MCFTRVPLSLFPLHPQPRPTKNAKNVPLSWCIVDSHGGRIAICIHSLRTMFCNCTFRNMGREGWGGFFVCRRTRFPQKRCSVWWKPFLFARTRPQNHFLFLFGNKTRLFREKERDREKERASLRAARTKSFFFPFQIVLSRERIFISMFNLWDS